MPTSLGKQRYLYDACDANGKSVIQIWCDRTVYQRKDGSLFVRIDGKSYPITRKDDGTLHMRTLGKPQ